MSFSYGIIIGLIIGGVLSVVAFFAIAKWDIRRSRRRALKMEEW